MFEFDFLVSALRNILMMLGTNAEQDEMTCYINELQLWLNWGGGGGGGAGTFVVVFFLKTFSSFCSSKLVRSISKRIEDKYMKLDSDRGL